VNKTAASQKCHTICKVRSRAVASTIQAGGEKISGGAKYLSSFLKFEEKNRCGRSKSISFVVCYFCVIFESNKIGSH